MPKSHSYELTVTWTGDRGSGTSGYRAHEVSVPGRPPLLGSSDPGFRGEPDRWNPEQLLVAALSQCHMLSYLHLCADAGIVVTAYVDNPRGVLAETSGGGHFTEVVLRPQVRVASPDMVERATGLHVDAHKLCFIAKSVNFLVLHEPVTLAGEPDQS
jgi:organic hydroperoxide reductase OsmC/OhrA